MKKSILCFLFAWMPLAAIAQEGYMPDYRFDGKKYILSEEEWEDVLPPDQFRILRKDGTEPAFGNAYYDNQEKGIYFCAGCGLPLFSSEEKFDSGTGWPSFWQPICPENIYLNEDHSLLMTRIAVSCSRCDGHLGHVFNDGPPPTGKRYCMNSGALQFLPK